MLRTFNFDYLRVCVTCGTYGHSSLRTLRSLCSTCSTYGPRAHRTAATRTLSPSHQLPIGS